jgi:hypothetical protein
MIMGYSNIFYKLFKIQESRLTKQPKLNLQNNRNFLTSYKHRNVISNKIDNKLYNVFVTEPIKLLLLNSDLGYIIQNSDLIYYYV